MPSRSSLLTTGIRTHSPNAGMRVNQAALDKHRRALVNAFLGELAKKLAERWVTLLVLPGLLWVSALAVAGVLGQKAALDPGRLLAWINGLATNPNSTQPAVVIATCAGILAAAATGGLTATWLGRVIEHTWTTPGRQIPATWLAAWRRTRWNRAYAEITAAVVAAVPQADTAPVTAGHTTVHAAGLAKAVDRCTKICPVPADRPTWIGDRLRAVDVRVHAALELDLSAVWPRLWLTPRQRSHRTQHRTRLLHLRRPPVRLGHAVPGNRAVVVASTSHLDRNRPPPGRRPDQPPQYWPTSPKLP